MTILCFLRIVMSNVLSVDLKPWQRKKNSLVMVIFNICQTASDKVNITNSCNKYAFHFFLDNLKMDCVLPLPTSSDSICVLLIIGYLQMHLA